MGTEAVCDFPVAVSALYRRLRLSYFSWACDLAHLYSQQYSQELCPHTVRRHLSLLPAFVNISPEGHSPSSTFQTDLIRGYQSGFKGLWAWQVCGVPLSLLQLVFWRGMVPCCGGRHISGHMCPGQHPLCFCFVPSIWIFFSLIARKRTEKEQKEREAKAREEKVKELKRKEQKERESRINEQIVQRSFPARISTPCARVLSQPVGFPSC